MSKRKAKEIKQQLQHEPEEEPLEFTPETCERRVDGVYCEKLAEHGVACPHGCCVYWFCEEHWKLMPQEIEELRRLGFDVCSHHFTPCGHYP